jgi:hypothetical protein
MAAARIKAGRSSSAAKALRDGQAGILAGPWYMAAGCSPEIKTRYRIRVTLRREAINTSISFSLLFLYCLVT